MDKLPEYLRETVDWFMGKTRSRGRLGDRSSEESGVQKLYLHENLLELRVPEPELIFLTDLPGGLDVNEWIASHTIGFFEHINLVYGTVSEFCTQSACPDMQGPGPRQYSWIDEKGKKSRLSAPQYIDYIMTFVQKTINDDTIFPTKHGIEFPSTFETHVKKIHRLLFHVLAHIYHVHFKEVVLLQLHAHLNAIFAHFVEFNIKFHTVEDKELEVLDDLIVALRLAAPQAPPAGDSSSGQQMATSPPASEEDNKENIEGQQQVICCQPTGGGGGGGGDPAAASASSSPPQDSCAKKSENNQQAVSSSSPMNLGD